MLTLSENPGPFIGAAPPHLDQYECNYNSRSRGGREGKIAPWDGASPVVPISTELMGRISGDEQDLSAACILVRKESRHDNPLLDTCLNQPAEDKHTQDTVLVAGDDTVMPDTISATSDATVPPESGIRSRSLSESKQGAFLVCHGGQYLLH
jgi:hypothetical protein